MTSTKRLFIFAGEPSGDLHGSRLCEFLKKNPHMAIEGIPGPKMRDIGVISSCSLIMEDFEVMGFSDVIRALPKLYKHFQQIVKTILKTQPEAVILIDYPGFNLRLAKALRKKKYLGKIIHYISPSVWAWGKYRIQEMEKNLDLLLTIYPFEAAHFINTTLEVNYVGSPVKQYISEYQYHPHWQEKLGIPQDKPLIALFPGSRKGEISRNLPIICQAAQLLLQENPNLIFGISCANETVTPFIENELKNYPGLKNSFHNISSKYTYDLMKDSRCAIAKSGTVTLELALHKCPTVVIYQLSFINRFYAQYLLKVNLPHYCIVNILAQKEVFPELIEKGLNPENICMYIQSLLGEGSERQACIQACEEINCNLGANNASEKAAQSIFKVITC